jgi:hypothetical protein
LSYRPFREAREFVHKLGLKSKEEWDTYCKSGKKPPDIPGTPHNVPSYKKEWKGWGDWLGTGRIASFKMVYLSFEEAREFVHKLGLTKREEWYNYCKSGKKPQGIPNIPWAVYKGKWKSQK